jgi:hypothetical protein
MYEDELGRKRFVRGNLVKSIWNIEGNVIEEKHERRGHANQYTKYLESSREKGRESGRRRDERLRTNLVMCGLNATSYLLLLNTPK